MSRRIDGTTVVLIVFILVSLFSLVGSVTWAKAEHHPPDPRDNDIYLCAWADYVNGGYVREKVVGRCPGLFGQPVGKGNPAITGRLLKKVPD
jgi:hypothetical protein